jgi:hypothetical protein
MLLSNLAHFFEKDGILSKDLPNEAKALALTLSEIVCSATSKAPRQQFRSKSKCFPSVSEDCDGTLITEWDPSDDTVHWGCPQCDSLGIIAGWEGTIFDKRRAPKQTPVFKVK